MRKTLLRILTVCLAAGWLVLSLDLLWPKLFPLEKIIPEGKAPSRQGVNYLVLAPEAFANSAQAWAAYRQAGGYQTRVVLLKPEEKDAANIGRVIRDAYYESGQPYPFYVLLLGAPYPDTAADAFLPPHAYSVSSTIAQAYGYRAILGDGGYAFDEQRNEWLPIAIGRIPLEDDWLIGQVLIRTQNYENGSGNNLSSLQVQLTASDARWGDAFGLAAESMLRFFAARFLDPQFQFNILYGFPKSAYSLPLEQYPAMINEGLRNSPLWWTYVGHGGDELGPATAPDGQMANMYTLLDALAMPNANRTIATFVACNTGSYDHRSFSYFLFFLPKGPAAVFASSIYSFDISNTFLQRDLMNLMLDEQIETVGEWTRLAKFGYRYPAFDESFIGWLAHSQLDKLYARLIRSECEADDIFTEQDMYLHQLYGYNLFGDPALRIRHAQRAIRLYTFPFLLPGTTSITFHGTSQLPEGAPLLIWVKPYPGSQSPTQEPSNPLKSYLETTHLALSAVLTSVDAKGEFNGTIAVSDLKQGKYILQAASLGKTTFTGYATFYVGLGWIEILLDERLWWVALLFIVPHLIRKAVQYHQKE